MTLRLSDLLPGLSLSCHDFLGGMGSRLNRITTESLELPTHLNPPRLFPNACHEQIFRTPWHIWELKVTVEKWHISKSCCQEESYPENVGVPPPRKPSAHSFFSKTYQGIQVGSLLMERKTSRWSVMSKALRHCWPLSSTLFLLCSQHFGAFQNLGKCFQEHRKPNGLWKCNWQIE